MKASTLFFASILFACLFSSSVFGQAEFTEKSKEITKEHDATLKQNFRAYKVFELNVNEIKKLIRKNKSSTLPTEFTVNLDGQKFKFSIFENDILADDYVYIEGDKASKKGEVDTYAGYVNDHPKNAVRLFISDKRISGIFSVDDTDYVLGMLSDYYVFEKSNNADKKNVCIAKLQDEYSNLGTGFCANKTTAILNKNARIPANCANNPTCKYVRLAVETDYEFYLYSASLPKDTSITKNYTATTVDEIVKDMVNRMDFIYSRDINIRFKLVACKTYTQNNDDYSASTTGIWQEVFDKNPLAGYQKDILHFLSGRPLGVAGDGDKNYGQSNQGKLCSQLTTKEERPTSLSSIACSSTCKAGKNDANRQLYLLNYSDADLVMAHEIGHVLGGDHSTACPPASVLNAERSLMCSGENKKPKFWTQDADMIHAFLCSKPCLKDNFVNPSFSNKISLTLNGNAINSTPVFINKNTKVVAIPPDPNPLLQLIAPTTFTYSTSAVNVFYKNLNATSFALGSANSFTLNVSAKDKCNVYYWGVPFTYAPYGARVATTNIFPNPAEDNITLEDISLDEPKTDDPIVLIRVYTDAGELKKEMNPIVGEKLQIKTNDLNSGLYYMQLVHKSGEIESKQVKIQR